MRFSNFFCCYKLTGNFWFRIFGYGLAIKDWRKSSLSFRQRNFVILKKPILYIGYYIIEILTPKN
jgi:hypothetical protein